MLERASAVEQAEQERADGAAIALLMPSKAGDNTVTIALMLDFEHHALVGFVGPSSGFGHYAIKAGAFKTPKPIGGPTSIDGCRRHMNGGAAEESSDSRTPRRRSKASPHRSRLPSQSTSKNTIDAGF